MAKPFDELRERLLRAGVAPRHVRRYLSELGDHLSDLKADERGAGRCPADAQAAALIRLGGMDHLANAMIEKRQFRSWSNRVPWIIYSLGPLLMLAVAYYISLFILWSGWQLFLPGADTPFLRIHGFAIFYFRAGRLIYFGAPILVGWVFFFIAARQRFNALWPIISTTLVAFVSGAVEVRAGRTVVPGGLGHIRMFFALPGSGELLLGRVVGAVIVFSLGMVPYFVWRLRRVSLS